MKKFLLLSLLAVGLSIPAYGEQVPTPTMSGDNPSLDYAGVSTFRLTSTESTNAMLVSSNPVIVYGVVFSSVAATTYLQLYSTNSVTLGGASPVRLQWNDDNNEDEGVAQDYKWAAPIRFNKGLVIKASAAVTPGPQSEIVVLYRESK